VFVMDERPGAVAAAVASFLDEGAGSRPATDLMDAIVDYCSH
jgi:hypothetical protein